MFQHQTLQQWPLPSTEVELPSFPKPASIAGSSCLLSDFSFFYKNLFSPSIMHLTFLDQSFSFPYLSWQASYCKTVLLPFIYIAFGHLIFPSMFLYILHMRHIILYFVSLSLWLVSYGIIPSRPIHLTTNFITSSLLLSE